MLFDELLSLSLPYLTRTGIILAGIDEIPISFAPIKWRTGRIKFGIKFYRFLEGRSIIRIFNFVARVIEGGGIRRETGYVLEMLLKNSIANNWSRFVEHCCRVPGISKEQIKRNRTRPTSMKHSGFRKGNDPRCIYTIEARFSPHRTAILQPYGNGDCNASVFHALFVANES